ncbi:MAG: CAP domain-containing protein [Alphaproteobacteria bacterium]
MRKHGRRFLWLVVVLALAACSSEPPIPADAESFNQAEQIADFLPQEIELAELVAKWARTVFREPPVIDARLTYTCRSLALRLATEGAQAVTEITNVEIQDEMIRFGVSESAIRTQMVAALTFDKLEESIGQSAREELSQGRYTHFGVGVVRRWLPPMLYAAIIFSRRPVAIDPFPKRVEMGDRIELSGVLLEGLNKPTIYLSPPSGKVYELLIDAAADGSFRTKVFFGYGSGLYRLEVSGIGSGGPEIVALMPVLVGDAEHPPAVDPGPPAANEEEARQRVLAQINRERAENNLPPLRVHQMLETVAQTHAEEMRELRYAMHRSPTTGLVSDRATMAGLRWRRVSENVAVNQTAMAAHIGLMNSPAHRANVLDDQVDLIGIGVAFADNGHGHRAVYLVENFMSLQ